MNQTNDPSAVSVRCVFGLRFHFLRVWEPKAGAKKTLSPNWFVMWMRVSVRPRWSAAAAAVAAVTAAPLFCYSCFFRLMFFFSFVHSACCCLLLYAPFIVFSFSLFFYGFSVCERFAIANDSRSMHRAKRVWRHIENVIGRNGNAWQYWSANLSSALKWLGRIKSRTRTASNYLLAHVWIVCVNLHAQETASACTERPLNEMSSTCNG